MPAKSGKVKRKPRVATKSAAQTRRGASKSNPAPKKATDAAKTKNRALTFRPRVPGDDDYILNLTEKELGQVHSQSFGEPFPRAQFQGYLQSGAPTVVVEQDGKPIGYYSYLIGPDGKMHVSALVIEPALQSGGVGTQVMTRLEDDARRQHVHTLEVFVQESNARSIAFTKKLGFVEVYRMPPNSICFQKVIAGQSGTSVAVGRIQPGPMAQWGV
ncbi:GNAT family N-acetyltransferase [Alicyclobacillus curvatus]|jgi:ribosomal protein S18 acetylase RimI-like enzyme|nr:GNAT family N-acetyltransferase [Alicyclobacillus curvatus]